MDDPVVIAEHDPAWPAMFLVERARILRVIDAYIVDIEHVGSTAVPGLAAKPVIDMMIGLGTMDDAAACIRELGALGYEYVPELEAMLPERRYLRRTTNGIRSHQVHMVEHESAFWRRHLLFRDHLRVHPGVARDYEVLKRALAEAHAHDRAAYTDGKTDFIKRIEAIAAQPNTP